MLSGFWAGKSNFLEDVGLTPVETQSSEWMTFLHIPILF